MKSSVKKVILPGQLWNTVLDEHNDTLFADCRNEQGEIEIVQLDLKSLNFVARKVDHSKWTQLSGVKDNQLFFVEYQDQHDPNQQKYFSLEWTSGKKEDVAELKNLETNVVHPSIYEHGSEYFKTVAEFLSLDLPLACEYLEWNDKIIISYYLRSGNEFERNLLLLSQGEKEWKILQDDTIRGFSAGSFFVHKDQLVFVKNRNEVCICTL